MKKFLSVTIIFLGVLNIYSSDCPIIFIHGHNSSGNTSASATWSNYYSAMMNIIREGYGDYEQGIPRDCDMNTQLQSTSDTRRIYNFSYYHPEGKRGVISYSDESVLVYIKHVYDKIGRHFIIVVAPFDPNYPPSDYDSTTYYPKHIPSLTYALIEPPGLPSYHAWVITPYAYEYIKSWKKGKFAKRLSEFIDKVLDATGASKVDIVSHSMGAIVARAAIKKYGCASKVRKLLMLGGTNHPYDRWWEDLYQVFGSDKPWQKQGENIEMGLSYEEDETPYFMNLQNGNSDFWGDLLGYNNYIEAMATIAGDKGEDYFGDGPNDGVVAVSQVHLNSAQFNPIIYVSHSFDGIETHTEFALTTCVYTTEFIKMWIIDDSVVEDVYFTCSASFIPELYEACELNIDFDRNMPNWNPILSSSVRIFEEIGRVTISNSMGYGWHTKNWDGCGTPVFCLTPQYFVVSGEYFFKIIHQNMKDGDVKTNTPNKLVVFAENIPANVEFNIPTSEWEAGDRIEITNITLCAYDPDDTTYQYRWTDQSYQDCEIDQEGKWTVPYRPISDPSDSIILKCEVELDPITYLRCWKKALVYARTAPENLTLNYNGYSVQVSWDSMSENDYYEIWWRDKATADPFILIGTSNSSPYYHEDLIEGDIIFQYKVRGNFTNFTDYEEINFWHLAPPTNLQANIYQDSKVKLTWQDNSDLNAGYEIKRKDIVLDSIYKWAIYQPDVESEIDDGVDPSHPAYKYWVRAFDEGWAHTSSWAGPITAKFDVTPPNVNVYQPGQYRVVYEGPFTVKWYVSDDFGYGLSSQKLFYPYGSVNLNGDVRSKEVNLETSGKGSEEQIKLKAKDYADNTGEDANTAVIIDSTQTDIPLYWEHDSDWNVTIYTPSYSGASSSVVGTLAEPPPDTITFDRVYKGRGNNWEKIDFGGFEYTHWTDPVPLNEGETRDYLVCKNEFNNLSDTLTVHRPLPPPPPCPVLYTFTGNSFELDNSLLPASEFTHQLTRDYYILKKNPKANDGAYRFKIIEGVDNTYIDLIKLHLIDHSKGKKLGILPNGETTLFNPSILPVQAIDNKGKDWKDSLLTKGSGYYYGRKGNTLNVKFNKKGDYLYTILAPPKDPVEAQSESEGSTMLYSRMNGTNYLSINKDSVIRYLPQDSLCHIDYVRKATRLPNPQITEIGALHIDLPQEVTKEDSIYYHLSPGDTLEFSFKASEMDPRFTRSYCIEIVGYYLEVGELLSSPKGGESGSVYETETVYENYIRPSSSIIPGNLILNASSNEEREAKIEVIDRIGRIVKRKDIRLRRGEQRIDLGGLNTGIYFIKVSLGGEEIHKVTVIR